MGIGVSALEWGARELRVVGFGDSAAFGGDARPGQGRFGLRQGEQGCRGPGHGGFGFGQAGFGGCRPGRWISGEKGSDYCRNTAA